MRLVRIFTNANKARVPQEMLHPAEIEAGLVKIISVDLTAVEEPDPGGMSVLLKVLPILDIDPHDPVDVRDREPQFSAGRENTKPATQNDRDFCVGKMLEHVARVNRLREAIGKAPEFRDIVHDVDRFIGRNVDVAITLCPQWAAAEMEMSWHIRNRHASPQESSLGAKQTIGQPKVPMHTPLPRF